MLSEFLQYVAVKNSYQEKYLIASMEDITFKEVQKLENLLGFYYNRGDSVEQIADKYLYKINFIMDDQKYFIEHLRYRYSSFQESEELYKNEEYMNSYIVGLGLSIYLWNTNRLLLRFFIKQISKIQNEGLYLEIGPGHGEYFVTAMENTKYEKYIAVDISKTSVDMTKSFCEYSLKNIDKNYEILYKDFFEFTSADKFDAVVMGEVLEHVEEPLKFLSKIYDVAREDAFIFITTAINAPQPDHIYHFKTTQEVEDMLEVAGFEIIEQVLKTANNVSMEKAIKKKYAIVVGYVLKKK